MTATGQFSGVRGVLLDLDGTLYVDGGLIPGAEVAVEALRTRGLSVRFVTNTTRRPRSAIVEQLRRLGLDVSLDEVITAPMAAVEWLRARGSSSVALYLSDATQVEFDEFSSDDQTPAAVVVGDLGDAWTFGLLNRAFRQLLAGAELVAIQRNRYWRGADGLMLDAGPFIAALEYASDKKAFTVGKPSAAFFEAAARSLGHPHHELVMVGDDIVSDVGGAISAGLQGVLVRTGKYRPEDTDHGVEPHAVIDSVADLPGVLRGGR